MIGRHPTRLTQLCEHVIEGCWLASLVAAPLFFNVYSSRIFEPDKTAVVRSIGLIMALAWIVIGLERWGAIGRNGKGAPQSAEDSAGRSLWRRCVANPIVPLALLLLIYSAFATAISVAPRFSFWGSYPRAQGLYTTAVYIGIFISIIALVHTREQLERIITTALVVSLPVSLYGIIQYFGTDPLLWASDVTLRVASTMGNPLFVAAFLILTVPPALYRLLASWRVAAEGASIGTKYVLIVGGFLSLVFQMASWQAGPVAGTASAVITVGTWFAIALLLGKPLIPFLRISIYTVVLSAQLMCILFSQSRGPWLGLAVGLFLFALLWTIVQRRRKQAIVVIGSGLAVASLLVVMNVPGSPVGLVRDVPYAGRLGQLFDAEAGSGRVRVLIWEGVDDLIADDPVRTLVGYGPETLHLIYPPHYAPELARVGRRDALPDRAHNETFDALITTGLLGCLIYVLFFTSLFYCGLKWIGLLRTQTQRRIFLGLWFGGGGVGLLLVVLFDGSWRFAGVALPLGMVVGMLVYLCCYGLFMKADRRPDPATRNQQLIVVTLLTALMVHFLEIQLGLAIVATRTYFWSYAAVLVVCGFYRRRRPDLLKYETPTHTVKLYTAGVRRVPRLPLPAYWSGALMAGSLIVGFVLMTLVYDLLGPSGKFEEAVTVLWLLAFTWGLAGLVVITETWPASRSMRDVRHWLGAFGVYGAISVFTMLLYAVTHGSLIRLGVEPGNVPWIYFAATLLTVTAAGAILLGGNRAAEQGWVPRLAIVYLIVTAAALAGAYLTNVNMVRADVYFKQAYQLGLQGRYDEAVDLHRRSIALEPKQDVYYLALGRSLLQQAGASRVPTELLEETESVLAKARALSPLNPDHSANLARLYRTWARRTESRELREERFRLALDLFKDAAALSPNTAPLWNDMAATYLLTGDTTAAMRAYRHSLALDDAFYQTYLLLGNLHFAQERWREAASAYERVIELKQDSPQMRIALGFAKAKMEEVRSMIDDR